MENSTLCNGTKQEHQGKCSNPSLSNPTKATNTIEDLESVIKAIGNNKERKRNHSTET
jgi:hypothetical protein